MRIGREFNIYAMNVSSKIAIYIHIMLEEFLKLTLASLLVAIEKVVRLLLAGPLQVQGEDDDGGRQCGEDESAVIDAESLMYDIDSMV